MKNKRNLFIYHDIVAALVSAGEARDINTYRHSARVSDMSEAIAYLMGLDKDSIEIVHIAADLHDIGKIAIPDNILFKPTKLNNDEWNIMKSHTTTGYDILKKLKEFEDIAKIVRHHHERWDGCGYPDKKSYTDIPLGSRIIAIADSIDAMMSNRSYRNHLSSSACKEEIEKNIGIMYDPTITRIILNNWEEIINQRNKS